VGEEYAKAEHSESTRTTIGIMKEQGNQTIFEKNKTNLILTCSLDTNSLLCYFDARIRKVRLYLSVIKFSYTNYHKAPYYNPWSHSLIQWQCTSQLCNYVSVWFFLRKYLNSSPMNSTSDKIGRLEIQKQNCGKEKTSVEKLL
jgi:hypothetical protein